MRWIETGDFEEREGLLMRRKMVVSIGSLIQKRGERVLEARRRDLT